MKDCFNKRDEITLEVQINEGNAHHHPSVGVRGYLGLQAVNLTFKFCDAPKIDSDKIEFACNHIVALLKKIYEVKVGG